MEKIIGARNPEQYQKLFKRAKETDAVILTNDADFLKQIAKMFGYYDLRFSPYDYAVYGFDCEKDTFVIDDLEKFFFALWPKLTGFTLYER